MFRVHKKFIAASCTLLFCTSLVITARAEEIKPDPAAQAWMQTVLDHWENVCRKHLRLSLEPLAWVIFYDENYAWHLRAEKELLPTYETATVKLNFAGKSHELLRIAHKQGLWVPGREEGLPIKVGLSAMPYANDQKTFCIIPLPSLFHKLAPADQALHLDELFAGIAQHELTHTRQLSLVMGKIKRLGKIHPLPEHLDDNLLEDTFAKNKVYTKQFNREMDALGDAAMADSIAECRRQLAQGLTMIAQRRSRYFVGKRKIYAPLEEIFLTLEGAAMWAHFKMARDYAPAGEDVGTTLNNLAARTNAWSQVEGLVLFLLIDRLVPNWQTRYFAPNSPSPFTVLRAVLQPKKTATKKRRR